MALKTYAEALLKDVFLPTIIKLEAENTVLSNRLIRTARDIRGNKIISPTMMQAEQGIGNRARGGALQLPSDAQFEYAEATLRHAYGSLQLYGQDRIMSEGNTNERIAEILGTKVASLGASFATDINRQYWGDASGALAVCETAGSVTTATVDSVQFLRVGMIIDIDTDEVTITAMDKTAKTITWVGAKTVAVDDIIYRHGNKDIEILGLKAMIKNTGTYLGLSRATYDDWRSLVIDHETSALTLEVIDRVVGRLIAENESVPSVIYTDEPTVRWIKYLYQKQGLPLDYMNINLGYRAIQYVHPKGAMPIVIEPFSPAELTILDERYITVRQPKPIHWLPGYDGNFWRIVEGYDKEVAHLRYYLEMFNINPKTCGRLHNYTNPIV